MKQKVKFVWFLAAAAMALCTLSPMIDAKMVSTIQAFGQTTADQDRARVQSFLDRADARQRLQAMGIEAAEAKVRVMALTDREAHELARKLGTLPAGGDISNRQLIAILLAVLLVLLLI